MTHAGWVWFYIGLFFALFGVVLLLAFFAEKVKSRPFQRVWGIMLVRVLAVWLLFSGMIAAYAMATYHNAADKLERAKHE